MANWNKKTQRREDSKREKETDNEGERMEDSSSNDEVDYVEETEYEENKFAASCPDCKADSK